MQVKKIMSDDLKSCTPDMTLQEAARMMLAADCGALPVVNAADHRWPVGIITDRDIACRAVAEGKSPTSTHVEECMTEHVASISPETTVDECCHVMEQNQVRRILVTDSEGNLCGIVAQADVALHLPQKKTAEVVKEVSRPSEAASAVG